MEVESKAKLTKLEAESLAQRLSEAGTALQDPVEQKDVYYKEAGYRDKVQGVDGYIIRVRYAGEDAILNMKRLTAEPGVWRELETGVVDGKVVEKILLAIGLEHAVDVTKTRRAAKIGNLEVIIDQIEELGTYLEVAVEGPQLDIQECKKTIGEFLERHGITPDRVEYRGYPTILLENQGVAFSY